jgi:hypothetical protein
LLYTLKASPAARQRHHGHRATGATHPPGQNRSLRRFRWLILAGRQLRFPFPLLPKGRLSQLPRVLSMLAGISGPIGMAEPLLQLGRLLVPLDRPLMGGQLPALGYQRPFTRARPEEIIGNVALTCSRLVWRIQVVGATPSVSR